MYTKKDLTKILSILYIVKDPKRICYPGAAVIELRLPTMTAFGSGNYAENKPIRNLYKVGNQSLG
jgi:hypothetical protein